MTKLEVHRKVADGSAVEAFLANSVKGTVLVQVSRPVLGQRGALYRSFLDTARRSVALRHPAILSPTQVQASDDGRVISVSEPLSGRTALDYLRSRGALGPDEAIRWALRLCEALEYLHASGVVHGHVSAANVFLDGALSKPNLRLLDTSQLLFRGETSLKVDNATLVDPEYLSPERIRGQRGLVGSDVYGLGVLITELLTRVPPFRGPTPALTKAAHLSGGVPTLPSELSAWQPIVSGCLHREVRARWTVAQLKDALLGLALDGHGARVVIDDDVIDTLDVVAESANATPQSDVLHAGMKLGNYVLGKPLGQGGMGAVFEASHALIGRKVAIKILRPELMQKQDQMARFIQEAQAVNRVQHPNVVQIVDCAQTERHLYLVMELLEGQTVKALGKGKTMSRDECVRIIAQAADGLSTMHRAGVVHRDIKPDNLFVTTQGVMKVLDFGVARMAEAGSDRVKSATTEVGQVIGTPTWMAPEQLIGREAGPSADVYSLSLVLYVLLVHRFPFRQGQQYFIERVSVPPLPIGGTTAGGEPISSELQELVDRGLCVDLALRPSMGEIARTLRCLPQAETALTPTAQQKKSLLQWLGLGKR
jgi:serine/threonine protein kinase